MKPGDFGHCQGDTLYKCCHQALQVDKEGVQMPPANDLDSTVGDGCLVERHGTPREK